MDDGMDKLVDGHCRTDFTWAENNGGCLPKGQQNDLHKAEAESNNKTKEILGKNRTDQNEIRIQIEEQKNIFSKFLSTSVQNVKEEHPCRKLLERMTIKDDYHFDGYLLKVRPIKHKANNQKVRPWSRPGPPPPLPHHVASQFRPGV